MNALSGKFSQHPHTDGVLQVDRHEYYSKIAECKFMQPDSATPIGYINRNKILVRYEKKEEFIRGIKPSHVGSIIYSEARAHLYPLIYRLTRKYCLYADTDSIKFPWSQYENLLKDYLENTIVDHNPEMEEHDPLFATHPLFSDNTKVFGSFNNEFERGITHCFINDKKEYGAFKKNENGDITWCHFSFKGVQRNALILDISEPAVRAFVMMKKEGGKDVARITNQSLALNYDSENRVELAFSRPINTFKVFQDLINNKRVYMMNVHFQRDISETAVNVVYLVKTLTPGNIKKWGEEGLAIPENDDDDDGDDDE